MALKRNIPEEYMDYDYGFTGVSEEEYRKKETEADLKVSQAEKDAAKKEETKKYLALIVEDRTVIALAFAMLEVLMQKVSQKIQEHLIKKKLWLSYYQI